MKRWFSTSIIRTNNDTKQTVLSLSEKLKRSQLNGSKFLLGTIDSLINKYYHTLIGYFDISKEKDPLEIRQELWDRLLNNRRLFDVKIREDRQKFLNSNQLKSPQILYNNFLKGLYPLKNQSAIELNSYDDKSLNISKNDVKYQLINHNLVYKYYTELPKPKPLHIKANHLDDFITKFLTKRDFIKPNSLSLSFSKPSKIIVSTFNQMVNKRLHYIRMCSIILNDVRDSGLPLTIHEQNQLIFMNFFKDKPEIIEKVDNARKELNNKGETNINLSKYNEFNWNIYNSIKQSFNQKVLYIETYNILLFHAIRHDRFDIVLDILKELNLTQLLEGSSGSQLTSNCNHKTIELLLDYFSSKSFFRNRGCKSSMEFENTIRYLIDSSINIDIRLVNIILDGLVKLNSVDMAEFLISEVFLCEQDQPIDGPEMVIYKSLTAEDKQTYNNLVTIFHNLKDIIGDDQIYFKMLPNEGTFRKLISYYCSNQCGDSSFRKVESLLNIMEENYKLPITTRIFKLIFDKFTEVNSIHNFSEWNLKELVYITSKLINCHDQSYSLSQDILIADKINKIELSPQLKNFVNNFITTKKNIIIPKQRGNFLKLSDDLMNKVYQAYFSVIKNHLNLKDEDKHKLLHSIESQRLDLINHLNNVRGSNAKFYDNEPTKQHIYNNDEVNYVKKGFLVDLIDVVYSI